MTTGEVGAAAQGDARTPVVPAPPAPTLTGAPAASWQEAIAVLVALATDVLRTLHGFAVRITMRSGRST